MKLLLASNSPRRKELLTQLGYAFDVVKADTDESFPANLTPDQIAELRVVGVKSDICHLLSYKVFSINTTSVY
jgi:predicted house-cleaning NTP pyrophosphatase (Maf/HAM1 superfamily)